MSALPPVTFIVLVNAAKYGWHNACDPVTTIDAAADWVGETQVFWGETATIRVLRISDTLNTDDVTADAFDIIAKRMKGRAA
jgi:hypothetical protein